MKDTSEWPVQHKCKTKEADKEIKKQYIEKITNHIASSMEDDFIIEEEESDDEYELHFEPEDEDDDLLIQMKRADHIIHMQKVTQASEDLSFDRIYNVFFQLVESRTCCRLFRAFKVFKYQQINQSESLY